MFSQWLSGEISAMWAFLLALANGIAGLPPSELLSFMVAQAKSVSSLGELYMSVVVGSIIAGLLMFGFGRVIKTYPRAARFASRMIQYEKWPVITSKELFRAIFIGRLTPGVRSQVPLFAGFLDARFQVFLWAHILASFVWYCFWISLSKLLLLLTFHSEYKTVHLLGLLLIVVVIAHSIWHFLPIMRKIFRLVYLREE